jgi:4-hydroxybenzoate polyprenyltransferase
VVTPPAPPNANSATPDAVKSWIDWLPARAQDYARLARLDRPAGTWLLFWPCIAGLALAGGLETAPLLALWFGVGSIAMRGAGCVWNDIVDRDLDAQVERTRQRPVAAGRISVKAALAFAVALSLIGLVVLLQLRPLAQAVALASLIPVAAYPFMKRITWWPQAWLGITFNWGALVGWAAVAEPGPAMWLLWAGGIAWTLGYDTIYALQDIEDDALAGIKSSARALGARARAGVAGFYALALLLWGAALWWQAGQALALLALLPLAVHLGWQLLHLADTGPANALRLFRANRLSGLLWAAACAAVGMA